MKNKYQIWIRLYFLFHICFAEDIYQSVRVYNPTKGMLNIIDSIGVPLDHITGKPGVFIDLNIHEDKTIELLSLGIDLEITISNLTEYYKSRNVSTDSRDFPLGSMQGNYTWDELNARFDELLNDYPHIISNRIVIGQSIENRDIWAFKVSDNPNVDENEPEVLYTSLTHAREPVGMMNLFYFIQHLTEKYEVDNEVTFLVNNREMWFIPVVNPDGYVYNEVIEPEGGGMHRKNRLDTNCGDGTNRGVDLNRNYSYGWGSDNSGSSPNPCSTTYRGESEFSEPETQAVRDFIVNREFSNVLHYHTYSNIYIHPWGDGSLPNEPNLSTYIEIGEEMARYNGYVVGTGFATIGYTVNGDAVDWTFGDQNIISYVPEVGSASQGFWPSENEIIDLCEGQLHPNKIFSFVSGADIIIDSYIFSQENFMPGDESTIEVVIENRGLRNSGSDIEIEFVPINNLITVETDLYVMDELQARDRDNFSISVLFSDNAVLGSTTGIIVSIESENNLSRIDTIKFIIGEGEVLFHDDFENGLGAWSLNGDWGLTNDSFSGSLALSDSPDSDYQPGQETIAELTFEINLDYLSNPSVEFFTKWDIESNWDFVRFQAYIPDSGWISLQGSFTEPGSGQPAQSFGEHGYDGTQDEWVQEKIYLDQLNVSRLTGFRFIQTSDDYVEGDGFIFDDFSISGFPMGIMGDFNSDMYLDIYDILGIIDLLIFGSEATPYQLYFCDLDGSGMLDVMDLISLTNLILGI